jgi:hypothetical protein
MTLLVAQRQIDGSIWMIADTAITKGPISLRERQYSPKILPIHNGRALAGFSGDPDLGLSAILELDGMSDTSPTAATSFMFEKQRRGHEGLSFAYAWYDGSTHLTRIEHDRVEEVPTLHLGDDNTLRG